MNYLTFETERLLLRPTTEQDASFVFKLMNSPKWFQFIGDRQITSVENARQYIKDKMLPQLQRLGYSNYTMVRRADGATVGSCGLYDREGIQGIDIGFALLPEYEGRGYAYEAASCLLRAAFEKFGLHELHAITNTDNLGSQRLLEKIGLRKMGDFRLKDDDAELYLYTIDSLP